MSKIKNIFKVGVLVEHISSKVFTASFMKKSQPVRNGSVYGIQSKPPAGTLVGILADQGNEESLVAIPFDQLNDDLSDGEVSIGIPDGASRVIFKEDGRIVFKIGDTEGGDFAVRFNELDSGLSSQDTSINAELGKISTSIAAMVTAFAALGVTIPPYTQGNVTTDISTAKVDEIEMPEL